jgi:hypothetical protein
MQNYIELELETREKYRFRNYLEFLLIVWQSKDSINITTPDDLYV